MESTLRFEKLPIQVRLNRDLSVEHPWIQARSIEKPDEPIPPGTVVEILDRRGKWVGRGFFNGHARIALRILTRNPLEKIDTDFFRQRIQTAYQLRKDFRLEEVTDSFRLIHSEGDFLSGVVIDKFKNTLVIEFFSAGQYRFIEEIKTVLLELFPESTVYAFADERVTKQESFRMKEEPLPSKHPISEQGLKFWIHPGSSQKTGFYLDQRDNRREFAPLCFNRRVLDVCCFTGGFSISSKKLGAASEVIGIDLDPAAIETARFNAKANDVEVHFEEANLFQWLDEKKDTEPFDAMVVDPWKQTRSQEGLSPALKNYCEINRRAMRILKPGGLLLSCSCSAHVSEYDFLTALKDAANSLGRTLQVFRITGASPDHPFLAMAPESRYLKAIWCRVT